MVGRDAGATGGSERGEARDGRDRAEDARRSARARFVVRRVVGMATTS